MNRWIATAAISAFFLSGCQGSDKEIRQTMEKHAKAICDCKDRECVMKEFDKLVSYGRSVKNKRVKDGDALIQTLRTTMESAGECLGEVLIDDQYALKTYEEIGLAKPATTEDVLAGIDTITTAMCACDSMRCFAKQTDRLNGYAELMPAEAVSPELIPKLEKELQSVEVCLNQIITSKLN